MSKLEKPRIEEGSSPCEGQEQPQTAFERFSYVLKAKVKAVFHCEKKSAQIVFAALREADVDGKLEIIDGLIERVQGELVMRCLQSFPEVDPNRAIQKMIAGGQSAVVILNQFRLNGRLDEKTNAMIDREYYRLAPFIFPSV